VYKAQNTSSEDSYETVANVFVDNTVRYFLTPNNPPYNNSTAERSTGKLGGKRMGEFVHVRGLI